MAIAASFPSIKPSLSLDFANVGALDPRVTFTRSTTGTYYDGVTTAKAEENLFLYSQEFDNAYWTKTNATVTANADVAPDGTLTADKLDETSGTGIHTVSRPLVVLANITTTISVFVKAAERTFALIGTATNAVTVDLTTGVASLAVGTAISNISSANFGSGWFRISYTITTNTGTDVYFYSSIDGIHANRSYAGTTGSGIYLWGAQLEQRSAVTAYTPTTTQPITNYIPVLQTAAAGQARFDHNPTTGEALGLLIEEARTNLLTYSEDFGNAAWVKTTDGGASVLTNTVVAPDGTLTADKLIPDASAGFHCAGQSYVFSAAAFTFSFFAKAGEYGYVQVFDSLTSDFVNFNLLTGQVGSSSAYVGTITPVGNGWYRCIATKTFAAGTASVRIGVVTSSTAVRGESYTGDGYSGVYIWGAQLE